VDFALPVLVSVFNCICDVFNDAASSRVMRHPAIR
jgi:hypothetical protein